MVTADDCRQLNKIKKPLLQATAKELLICQRKKTWKIDSLQIESEHLNKSTVYRTQTNETVLELSILNSKIDKLIPSVFNINWHRGN